MKNRFHLGPWRVEVSSNRLIRDRREVRIEPRAMQVLAYLAENAGEVVTKEQLVQDVWEGAFVTDEALTYAVHELRKALGDDAKKPEFIETVPKKGYRLVAPVSFEEIQKVSKRVYWVAGALLLLTAGWILRQVYFPKPSSDLDASRVVVAEFENETGDETLDALGRMAADWISQGLSHTGVVETVPTMSPLGFLSPDEAEQVLKGAARLQALAEETEAGTVVSGAYYLEGESLHIQSTVTDLVDDKILFAFEPVSGPRDEAVNLVDQLRGRIMGFLAAHFGNESELHQQADIVRPPTYEAYREYVTGLDYFGNDYSKAVHHFERALELAPDFNVVRLYLAGAYNNLGEHDKAEEIKRITNQYRERLTPFERHYLDWSLAGRANRESALRSLRQAEKLAPNNEIINHLIGNVLLELNRPRESISTYSRMTSLRWSIGHVTGWWRWDNLCLAHHMLGDYEKELEHAREGRQYYLNVFALRSHEARALAALGHVEDIYDVIDESSSVPPNLGSPGEIMLEAAEELRSHGNRAESMRIVERSIEWHRSRPSSEAESERHRYVLARTHYTGEMWNKARALFEELATEFPGRIEYEGYLGVLAVRRGDSSEVQRIAKELEQIDRPRLFGENLYWLASMAAVEGDKSRAIRLLREGLSQSYGLFRVTLDHSDFSLHCEMNFESLRGDPDFQELIRPKG